jgi:tRNA/rRNA methyltransferase
VAGAVECNGREVVRQNYTMKDPQPLPDPLARIAVVLSRPGHPGNVGAVARAMKNMGLRDLRLVAPRRYSRPAASAMAAGAADVLAGARRFTNLNDALADCVLAVGFTARVRDLSHPAHAWRELAPDVLAHTSAGPVALVFGNETNGLSNEELLACQRLATIPADPAYPSLNLAAAVQIACYELVRAAGEFTPGARARRHPATAADLEALHAHLFESLVASGFVDPAKPRRLMERLRRLFARAGLERAEVNLLRGMLASLADARTRKRTR